MATVSDWQPNWNPWAHLTCVFHDCWPDHQLTPSQLATSSDFLGHRTYWNPFLFLLGSVAQRLSLRSITFSGYVIFFHRSWKMKSVGQILYRCYFITINSYILVNLLRWLSLFISCRGSHQFFFFTSAENPATVLKKCLYH